MSDNERDVTRRSALKGIAAGAMLGLGAVTASSTAAADSCQYVDTCGSPCWEGGVKVYRYECCEGDEWFEDCTLVYEYCGVCP